MIRSVQDSAGAEEEIQEFTDTALEERIQHLEACAQEFEKSFSRMLPILLNARAAPSHRSTEQVPPDVTEKLASQLQELTSKVDLLQQILWEGSAIASSSSTSLSSSSTNADQLLRDMQGQLKVLQQRVVGAGVQVGAKVFQSFEDVETWVKAELPTQRYGLFVDAVSLLDFFACSGHVDAEKTFQAFHNQQKTGFSSMYEARVAASVQNVFPMVFGKVSATGMDDSAYIPAIQDPNKWDNGVTGVKHQICRGMSDVEYQLESAIDSVLGSYPDARQLAKECLFKSKRFIADLCNFITNDFQKWKLRGHGQKDSWRMTAVCVRRIFEEIHSERVVARDIYDYKDSVFSTAKFLWATWKAHAVMDKYIKHQFYEHPSIAAVLARHLADNYIKPDDSLASKYASMDKAHKALVSRVDTISDKVNGLAAKPQGYQGGPQYHGGQQPQHQKNEKGRGGGGLAVVPP
jgi:hypothetical protein